MEVKIYNSITEIKKEKWNAIVGRNRLICRHEYLEAIEKSQINDCRFWYPVVYDQDQIIAHTCVYFISTELDTFARGITKKIINLIRRVWKNFLIMRSLECGTPVALGNTFSYKDGVDRTIILKRLVQEIESLAKKIKINIVLFRDFYDEELWPNNHLQQSGYEIIHNLPNTKLKLKWNSFNEYLFSLRSHYRCEIKKQINKCQQKDITFELIRDFSPYGNELERLWMQSYNCAKEYRREKLTSFFFENINKYLGNQSAIILIKKGELAIGFSLLLLDEHTLVYLFCGLDYTYNQKYGVYFNLFYKVIELGIKEKMKDIDMGITTFSPKKRLGGNVFSLHMYIKHFNPLLNKIVPKIFEITTPQHNMKEKNIFKLNKESKQ